MNPDFPVKLRAIYTAAAAALLLSNCTVAKPPVAPDTYDIRAQVVDPSKVFYGTPHIFWGKGHRTSEEIDQIMIEAGFGWSRSGVVVKTPDGKLYKGNIKYGPGLRYSQCELRAGDQGVATINRHTRRLICFHKDGTEPWHKHMTPSEKEALHKKMKYSIGSMSW